MVNLNKVAPLSSFGGFFSHTQSEDGTINFYSRNFKKKTQLHGGKCQERYGVKRLTMVYVTNLKNVDQRLVCQSCWNMRCFLSDIIVFFKKTKNKKNIKVIEKAAECFFTTAAIVFLFFTYKAV